MEIGDCCPWGRPGECKCLTVPLISAANDIDSTFFLICKKNILGSDFSLSPLSLTSAPKSVSSLMILIFLYPVHLVMGVTPSPANAIFPSLMRPFGISDLGRQPDTPRS